MGAPPKDVAVHMLVELEIHPKVPVVIVDRHVALHSPHEYADGFDDQSTATNRRDSDGQSPERSNADAFHRLLIRWGAGARPTRAASSRNTLARSDPSVPQYATPNITS